MPSVYEVLDFYIFSWDNCSHLIPVFYDVIGGILVSLSFFFPYFLLEMEGTFSSSFIVMSSFHSNGIKSRILIGILVSIGIPYHLLIFHILGYGFLKPTSPSEA